MVPPKLPAHRACQSLLCALPVESTAAITSGARLPLLPAAPQRPGVQGEAHGGLFRPGHLRGSHLPALSGRGRSGPYFSRSSLFIFKLKLSYRLQTLLSTINFISDGNIFHNPYFITAFLHRGQKSWLASPSHFRKYGASFTLFYIQSRVLSILHFHQYRSYGNPESFNITERQNLNFL